MKRLLRRVLLTTKELCGLIPSSFFFSFFPEPHRHACILNLIKMIEQWNLLLQLASILMRILLLLKKQESNFDSVSRYLYQGAVPMMLRTLVALELQMVVWIASTSLILIANGDDVEAKRPWNGVPSSIFLPKMADVDFFISRVTFRLYLEYK